MNSKKGKAPSTGANTSNPSRRTDLSRRHATEVDLEAFYYSKTLSYWKRLHDLTPLGNRILRAYCALNRAYDSGFCGTICCQEAISAFVERVTNERCRPRTLQRGLSELVRKGYFEREGPRGKKKVCTYTLTEKALSIWSDDSLPTPKRRTMDRTKPERKSQPETEIFSQTFSDRNSRSTSHSDLEVCDKVNKEPSARADTALDASTAPSARKEGGKPNTRKGVSESLLAFLRPLTKKYGRAGRVCMGRAVLELGKDPRALAEPSGVDWGYWLSRWASMTHKERLFAARVSILPLLYETPPKPMGKCVAATGPIRSPPDPADKHQTQPSAEDCIKTLQDLERIGWEDDLIRAAAARMKVRYPPQGS